MKRRPALAALGTLIAGCTSSCEHAVEPTGLVEPAGDIACVKQPGEGVEVTMTGVGKTDYARTEIHPTRDPELRPLELTRDQIADFPVLRNGLAYFSYNYSGIIVKSTLDTLEHRDWLESYWEDHRDPDVSQQKRPFRLADAVFNVWWIYY